MTTILSMYEGPLAIFSLNGGETFVLSPENTLEAKRQAGLARAAAQSVTDRLTGGPLSYAKWVKLPATYKLLLNGTGTVALETRTRNGTITANAAVYSPNGPDEDYLFFDDAYEVRATLTGTATAEII
jgi:hypothetical protein